MKHIFPSYNRLEQLLDDILHVAGIVLAVGAGAALLVASQPGAWPVLAIYVVALVGMMSASAVYNMAPPSRFKELARRIDHAAIFIFIAGSYTPFAVLSLSGRGGIYVLVAIWAAAIAGVVLKLVWPRRYERLAFFTYIAMGWAMLVEIRPLIAMVDATSLWLLLAGGLSYSLGTVFHSLERLRFHNFIWHVLVQAGVACHFLAILFQFAS